MISRRVSPEIQAVWLARDGHRFVLVYRDGRRCEALRQVGRWAQHPDLPFDWHDAARFSRLVMGKG